MAHHAKTHAKPESDVRKAFDRFDFNGNGILSLAEIDKACLELYPEIGHDKQAMMRAYKAADASKDGFVNFREFRHLVELLHHFHELKKEFSVLDKNNDRRISLPEFVQGHKLIGLHCTDEEAKKEFAHIDTNHGGYILFDEFCIYMAKKRAPPK